tara:strand:- start:119 stop:967 length:849 start_codon:yes stop_codon:yes gene_type:complete
MGSTPLKMHEGKPHSNDFTYGDWEEVGRNVDDAGVTTIDERRSGERDVEYSKRGVDWKVGYDKWLAKGNKGTLGDFKVEAERWKESQTQTETDVQNRQRMLEAQKREELKRMDSKPATTIKQPAGSTTKDKDIIVSKSSNTGGKKGGGKDVNVKSDTNEDSKKQSGTVDKTIKNKNPGSGPPPSGSSTYYSHPRVQVNNTRNTNSQTSKKGDILTYTNVGSLKYPNSPGDNTSSTSVTTNVFKPKIIGLGTRKRGTSTTTGETLNADGTVRNTHHSKKRIKR